MTGWEYRLYRDNSGNTIPVLKEEVKLSTRSFFIYTVLNRIYKKRLTNSMVNYLINSYYHNYYHDYSSLPFYYIVSRESFITDRGFLKHYGLYGLNNNYRIIYSYVI